MAQEVTYLTRESRARLEERLKDLRRQLSGLVREVHQTAAYGDLTENFEWEAAKHQRNLIRAEVERIEAMLAHHQLIENLPVTGDCVTIGTRVALLDVDTDEEISYSILGPEDVDIPQNIISHTSPIARQLLRKGVGDTVKIRTPSGTRQYEIVSVEKLFGR